MRMLRTREMQDRLGGVGRTTLWRWERDGLIPPRRRIGPGVAGWLEREVDEWLRERPIVGADDTGS